MTVSPEPSPPPRWGPGSGPGSSARTTSRRPARRSTWSSRSRGAARSPAPSEAWHDPRLRRRPPWRRARTRGRVMIVRAALCPSPPLLASGVTGRDALLPELRDACAAAVGWLLAAGPDSVTVLGPAAATASWPPDSVPDLRMHAPAAYPGPSPSPSPLPLPFAPAMRAQLLDAAD